MQLTCFSFDFLKGIIYICYLFSCQRTLTTFTFNQRFYLPIPEGPGSSKPMM